MYEFTQYDFSAIRLGNFLSGYVSLSNKRQYLWRFAIFIFALFHGQAVTERSFNVNNEVLTENLEEKTQYIWD